MPLHLADPCVKTTYRDYKSPCFQETVSTSRHQYRGTIYITMIAGRKWITDISEDLDKNIQTLIYQIMGFYRLEGLVSIPFCNIEYELFKACLESSFFQEWEKREYSLLCKTDALNFPSYLISDIYKNIDRKKRMYVLSNESKESMDKLGINKKKAIFKQIILYPINSDQPTRNKIKYNFTFFNPADDEKYRNVSVYGGMRKSTLIKLNMLEEEINESKSILSKYV